MKLVCVNRNNALVIKSTIKKYLNIDFPYFEGKVKTLTKEN